MENTHADRRFDRTLHATVAANIKAILDSRGMSVREFAEKHGIHRQRVDELVTCRHDYRLSSLARIAVALGVDAEKLFSKSEKKRRKVS